jgi:hypothetical protein
MEILRLQREGQNLNDSKKTTLARIEELKTRVRLGKSRQSELLQNSFLRIGSDLYLGRFYTCKL